jgi:CDP-paratose 2-epimerase
VSVVLVTGSAGLIGSEAVRHFGSLGFDIVGIDNDMRQRFFGPEASTWWNVSRLANELGPTYRHHDVDVRDRDGLTRIFKRYGSGIALVIHTAAQPSHDWAVRDPYTDFDVNAVGTLNVLQNVREHCIDTPVIHCSTNKVYGDRPNTLPLAELESRWEIEPGHPYEQGIQEDMPVDSCLHSIFGASKVAADVMVQEYGRYFDMKTACFRGGTLTGPGHAATELHGFLAYIMRCAMERRPYKIYGYQGKQVRDAIHSHDVIAAFEAFFRAPRSAEVYNLGGGRHSNASVLEAIWLAEKICGTELAHSYVDSNRIGDHVWWIGSNARFMAHYPGWEVTYDVPAILQEIYEANVDRWMPSGGGSQAAEDDLARSR